MDQKDFMKPIIIRPSNGNSGFVIGSVEGVNTKSSIQSIRKLLRYEIGMLYTHWLVNLSRVFAEWDNDQSSSWSIRMYPYSQNRLEELSKFLDKPFMDDVEQAWLVDYYCQPTHQPVDIENDKDMIELPVSYHEIQSLIKSYEDATDRDEERIKELKLWLISK